MTDSLPADGAPVSFRYTNHRGKTAMRRARPICVWYGSTQWHPEPGWLLTAHDLDRDAQRDFALTDCDFTAGRIEGKE